MKRNKIEVYKSLDGWRWRVRARNGEIVAVSEGYSTGQHALDGASALKRALVLPRTIVLH